MSLIPISQLALTNGYVVSKKGKSMSRKHGKPRYHVVKKVHRGDLHKIAFTVCGYGFNLKEAELFDCLEDLDPEKYTRCVPCHTNKRTHV